MKKSPAKTDAPTPLGDELSALLDGFADQHRALLTHVPAHRDAIRKAAGAGVEAAALAQTRVVGALGGLEQRRRELVALACSRFTSLGHARGRPRVCTGGAAPS